MIGKANPCQAADQYMQCVYQMIDNQVYNSNITLVFAFNEALDIRILYTFDDAFYFIPVSALQPRALKIKVVNCWHLTYLLFIPHIVWLCYSLVL